MNELKVVYRRTDELIPYENNPRINDRAVEAVAASIKEFGFKQPLVVDSGNVIVVGHTRLKAAALLGIDKVPCLIADDLTDEQIRAYRLADNKTAELAEWDMAKLEEELAKMDPDEMLLYGFGIDDAAFDTEVAEKKESEYEETDDKMVTCPSCGLTFSSIDG